MTDLSNVGDLSRARPRIVGIGGTTKAGSSTERALEIAMFAAAASGAEVRTFSSAFLSRLPMYAPERAARTSEEIELVEAVRWADGLILASPGYHGGVSGLVKNAIDLLEDTARDPRVYFDGMPVGLIVTAHGWQATTSTIASLRSVVHAMRGWPSPFGAAINSAGGVFGLDGQCKDPAVMKQLQTVGGQVMEFLNWKSRSPLEAQARA